MIDSFYTAAVSASQYQKGVAVLSNNIANLNTNGFKPSKASFSDLLYTNIQETRNVLVGHGTKVSKVDVLHIQGSLVPTGQTYDYAIMSDGFFGISTADGVKYTRDGNFRLTPRDDETFNLTSMQGGYVLDSNNNPVIVQKPDDNVLTKIDVGVFKFANNGGLVQEGNNFYTATANSGVATASDSPELRNEFLESSAVNILQELTKVIEYQRAFQFNAKIVQMADEIVQTANSLR